MEQKSKKIIWIIVAIIVVLAIAVIVAYMMNKANEGAALMNNAPSVPVTPPGSSLGNQGTATATPQMDGLNSSDLGNLNSDIQSIDSDINKL